MVRLNKITFFQRKTKGNNGLTGWIPELLVSLAGTVLGIILTVGVTYCSEKRDRDEMARKTVMLTIHNLDVSIRGMERLLDDLSRQDSIFSHVRRSYTASAPVSGDTLSLFISSLYTHNVRPIDTSTEAVFSSNIETWRNIDDPKVIGRIANCYSIMKKCGEEFDRIENEKYETFLRFYDDQSEAAEMPDDQVVARLLRQSRVERILDALPQETAVLRQMTEQAKALNNRNKEELGIRQEDLDEIGNLM